MSDERGFTLIELLVVILIIGLLAEIAIPSFLGQASKAYDAAAKSSVRTAQRAIETYQVQNTDYCGATPSILEGIEPTLSDAPNLTVSSCAGGDKTAYVLSVTSRSPSATVYKLTAQNGALARTCSPAGQGGCAGDGSW
jgi:type IV pilus assembly protein PilA